MRSRCAFTLLELLVVIAIMALLISILLPSLAKAKQLAKTANCLCNMRNMEVAHWMYMTAGDGSLIRAGLAHGGAHAIEGVAWINTLQPYYGNKLMARCPSDTSPHWPGGSPVPPSADQYRRCSYGINGYTDIDLSPHCDDPGGNPFKRIDDYKTPSTTVHFVEMVYDGEYSGADHPHAYLWVGNILSKASGMLQINAHDGETRTWNAKANYGFLDGHAETRTFQSVFRSQTDNNFDPALTK